MWRRRDSDPDRSWERDVLLDVERLGRQAVAELHRAVGILRFGSRGDAGTELDRCPGWPA